MVPDYLLKAGVNIASRRTVIMAGRSMRGMIGGSFKQFRLNKFIASIIIAAAVLVFISAMLVIFSGIGSDYSPVTKKCISCHNDPAGK